MVMGGAPLKGLLKFFSAAFALLLSGCGFFTNRVYAPPEFQNISVEPWRIVDRCPPGNPGGTLRLAEFGSGPKTFNPIVANESSSVDITSQIFMSLLDFNYKTNKVVGGLAYKWSHSKDGRTWIFYLRKGLLWSDGEPLTGDDVVFTLKAIYDPKVDNPNRDLLEYKGKPFAYRKIDDTTVEIKSPGPYGPMEFAAGSFPIVPKHKLEKALEQGSFSSAYSVSSKPEDIVGSGAFRVRDFVPFQRIILERNPYYFSKDVKGLRLPYLDRITVVYVPDMNAQFLKFLSGDTDAFTEFPSLFYDDLKAGEAAGHYRVVDLGQTAGTAFMDFNESPNPKYLDPVQYHWFSNRLFRLAVAYGINKDVLIRLAYLGHGFPVSQDFHPTSRFFDPKIKPFPYDPEKSKALLKEAGFVWKNGKLYDDRGNRVSFTLLTNSGNVQRRIMGELIKDDLTRLGMDIDFHPIDFNQLVSQLDSTHRWQSVYIGFGDGGSLEPSGDGNLWLSSGYSHEWNPGQKKPAAPWEAEIDKLVWDGIATIDFKKRKRIYDRIEEILYQEEVPMVLTVVSADLYAFRNTVGNADPTSLGHFWFMCPDDMLMSQVYMKKKS